MNARLELGKTLDKKYIEIGRRNRVKYCIRTIIRNQGWENDDERIIRFYKDLLLMEADTGRDMSELLKVIMVTIYRDYNENEWSAL